MSFSHNGLFSCYFGFKVKAMKHGYGRQTNTAGRTWEGYYFENDFRSIEYEPKNDTNDEFDERIDFTKYLIKK